jgi:predicted RND superfamily exporter protein
MVKKTLAQRYAAFVLRNRWLFIIGLLAATVYTAFYVDKVNLRNDPDSLLPLSNRYIATNLYSERHNGMGNLMVWGLVVREGDIYQDWFVRMLYDFYHDTTSLDYANPENFVGVPSSKLRHMGLSEEGNLDFKRLVPANGFSSDPNIIREQISYLKQGLEKHPVMENLLTYYEDDQGNKCIFLDETGQITNRSMAYVHENCKAKGTFIVGDFSNKLKHEPLKWIEQADALMEKYKSAYGDRVEFLVSGEPYFLTTMVEEVNDKSWLFGISLMIVLLVLWYEFKCWRTALISLVGVAMTIVMTLGLMGITQFKLTTMMVLTPMLLLAIGIGHSMQVTRRFMLELSASNGDTTRAAEKAIEHTIVPAALSIGTDLHGFFAISFVDISFYKAYAYFGIFGMSTLILTTTTLIPLLMMIFPPRLKPGDYDRGWEKRLGYKTADFLLGPFKWVPVGMVILILLVSAHYTDLDRGVSAMLAGEAGRSDPEVARIQDEFDIMPGVEKGINYPRAAFKEHYYLGELLTGDGTVKPIQQIEQLSHMMPGVITANILVRSRAGSLPLCGADAWNDEGERVIGPQKCYDEESDPRQGVFNKAEVLMALSEFEDWMRAHPNIGYTVSYVQFVKTVNMMINTPVGQEPMQHMNLFAIPGVCHMQDNRYAYASKDDPTYLPDPDRAVQLYNGIISTSTPPGELDSFVNSTTWDEGTIIGFVNTMDPVKAHDTIVDIQNYIEEHEDQAGFRLIRIGIEGGEEILISNDDGEDIGTIITEDTLNGKPAIGGFLGVTEATRDVAFAEWLHAPAMTSVTVFLMTAIMFRSWVIAIILVSICYVTLFAQYGLGGYMASIQEWSANLAFHVQVALSIAMGLGIDYGVYMVSRLREEMQSNGQNWAQALSETIHTTGSAIVLSVVVLLGSMIPLMNTELANLWSISLYISQALILDVILALTFLPLIVYWLKPKYIFEKWKTVVSKY